VNDREHTQQVEPLIRRVQQLERLLDLSRNLSSLLDLDPLLQSIIDAASDLTLCQEASILIYDEEDGNLEFVAAPWFKREKLGEIRVPLQDSIAGRVFTFGEPVMVADAQNDSRIYRYVDRFTGFETHSLLAVPMMFKGQTFGVLTAVNKLSGKFTNEDKQILENLASQASIAIQNANYLKETQKAYQDLADLDRMKSDFIAITSHELRTPLGLILGHATFMYETLPEDQQSQLDVIIRSASRLKDIVDDLSKVNSFQTGESRIHWQQIDVNQMMTGIAQTFREYALEKQLHLQLALTPEPLIIYADPEKLNIAISHLMRNAMDYTDPDGIITLITEKLPGFVKLSVQDTGIGIPEKDQERIFERFYQVEDHMTRKHGGMGLGLSVAQQMVAMHKGRILVNSKEGVGSTFTILLPQVDAR
jgi:signal transduction histidine kinase